MFTDNLKQSFWVWNSRSFPLIRFLFLNRFLFILKLDCSIAVEHQHIHTHIYLTFEILHLFRFTSGISFIRSFHRQIVTFHITKKDETKTSNKIQTRGVVGVTLLSTSKQRV